MEILVVCCVSPANKKKIMENTEGEERRVKTEKVKEKWNSKHARRTQEAREIKNGKKNIKNFNA